MITKNISYINNAFSEYIGSNIFKICGFEVQNTILGKYNYKVKFSPIYDCGSALNPMLEDEEIEKINEAELKNLAINCYSCLKENRKKINYMTYIKQMKNEVCNMAIPRIFLNINMNEINLLIM